MSRKKKIIEESHSLELKLKDLQEELELIEAKRLNDTEKLNYFIKEQFDNEYFAGVILTIEDVFALLRLLQKNETVKIPYNLYLNEA